MEANHEIDPGLQWPRNVKQPDTSNFHQDTYASSQFDLMKVLTHVAQRPNPQIDLGPIDCSAAIIVCDMCLEDNPIIYCSEAFCDLTGYSHSDVMGRNCRFLQAPDAANHASFRREAASFDKIHVPGGPSQPIDLKDELHRLKYSLSHNEEVQVVLLNYTKSGKAFLNLVTVVPIEPDGDHRYLVGFQAASAHSG